MPAALLLLRKPNGKFRQRWPSRTAQGLMHLICFLMTEFHYARTRMESSNVRAKVGRKTIRRWPQNVKLEWTRTEIPRISVIDLTVQCFVSLRRTGRALGGFFVHCESFIRENHQFIQSQAKGSAGVGWDGKLLSKCLLFINFPLFWLVIDDTESERRLSITLLASLLHSRILL